MMLVCGASLTPEVGEPLLNLVVNVLESFEVHVEMDRLSLFCFA